MVYIKRGTDGRITAVSEESLPGFEVVPDTSEELQQFLASKTNHHALEETDQALIRVVEDVIELLIAKNIILFTELPSEAQEKMLTRQRLRSSSKSSLGLLSDNDY